jgi:Protein of unknown function (DUF2971)
MASRVPDLYHFEGDVRRWHQKQLPRRADPAPPIIYHYTNIDSMMKIIASNRLWASDSRFVNDSLEFRHGISVLQSYFQDHRDTFPDQYFFKYWDWELQNLLDSSPMAFISCFCAAGDLLSQWRGYGSRGGGCAIGLSSAILNRRISPNGSVGMVIYDHDRKATFCKSVLELCTRLFSEYQHLCCNDEDRRILIERITVGCWNVISYDLAFLKSEQFSEEKECRVVYYPDDYPGSVKHRVADSG